MKRLLCLSALVLVSTQTTFAQQPSSRVAGKNQMTPVAPEVRLIEEDSLIIDPSLQSSSNPSNPSRGAKLSEDGRSGDNGLKMYRFTLAPGETLTTQIKCELADAITQQIGNLSGPDFTPSAPSKAQMARINRSSRQQRTTKIEYKNLEQRPFPYLLIVYGQVGHAFKIQISRELSK